MIHANSENREEINPIIEKIGKEFDNALEDDFNTHLALSAFFQLVKEANRLAAEEKLGKEDARVIKTELEREKKLEHELRYHKISLRQALQREKKISFLEAINFLH